MKKYRSLSDIYLEKSFNKDVLLPPRLQILCEKAKQKTADLPPIKIEVSDSFKSVSNKYISGDWSDFQKYIFNERKTGGGRGEYSVAALVSGLEPTPTMPAAELKDILGYCVSGQSESFDVAVPPDTKKYKFEVKELEKGSVRIGAEGRGATNRIVNGVMQILNDLENVYLSLDSNSRLQVDELLRKQLNLGSELKEPVSKRVDTQAYRAAYSEYQAAVEAAQKWTLTGFINAIYQSDEEEGRGIRELPASLIKRDATINPSDFKNPERKKFFLRNLQQVFDAIENIAEKQKDFSVAVPSKTDELKNIIKKLYLPEIKDDEQRNKELEFLDHEADVLDRKLTKRKCSVAGGGCLDAKYFFNSVNKMRLLNRLRGVQDLLKDPKILQKLFPVDITGLFIVNAAGYAYLPKDLIDQYIEIDQISAGGVKIIKKA